MHDEISEFLHEKRACPHPFSGISGQICLEETRRDAQRRARPRPVASEQAEIYLYQGDAADCQQVRSEPDCRLTPICYKCYRCYVSIRVKIGGKVGERKKTDFSIILLITLYIIYILYIK